MKAITYKPYNAKRPRSPWYDIAIDLADGFDDECQRIEEALSFAYLQGFKTADDNPRLPENMGR